MKKNQIEMFLQSEDGKRNAERFIKALKEKRIIACVKHVSSSGMSRDIAFREVIKTKYGYSMLQFDWFFEQLGWPRSKNYDAIRVVGCGMDMRFHVIYSVCQELQYYGFKLPKEWTYLADNFMSI